MKIVVSLVLLFLAQIGCAERWPEEPFTPEAWKALPWQEHYRLCHSLLESGVLDGATREGVIALLGPPSGTLRPDRISYLVRQRSILEVFGQVIGEVKVLDVRFDADGRVRVAFIRGT